ncbi:MAG: BlaI/MecI/CopY family transcriptional regulator [Pseudomonadota bacterium]
MPRPKGKSELLTSVELEYMIVLWQIGTGTVRDVLDILNRGEKRAYTSVATTLRVLHDKGYLSAEKRERTFVYKPTLSKTEYEGKSLRSLANALFDGAPTALVARLVEDDALSDETIKEIKAIIDTRFGG